MHRPDTMVEQVMLEKHMLEMVVKEWNTLEEMGSSYTQQAQKDVSIIIFALHYQTIFTI